MDKEEREYLDLVHKNLNDYFIQTKIFSLAPLSVKFDLFNGHCEFCLTKLHSRPTYFLKIPNLQHLQIKYLCGRCAGLHQKYIKFMIITKN